MKLNEINYIKNRPGLYTIVADDKGGITAQSIIDDSRIKITNNVELGKLSTMTVCTASGDIMLEDVFKEMSRHITIHAKENDQFLKEYFKSLIPDYDTKLFYPSHMRKIISWFNIIKDRVDFDSSTNTTTTSTNTNRY